MCVQSVISHLLFLLHRRNWYWSASTKLQLGVVGQQQIAPLFLLGVISFGIFFHFSSLVNWNLDLEQAWKSCKWRLLSANCMPFLVSCFFSTNGIAIAVKKASFCCSWLLEETFLSSSVWWVLVQQRSHSCRRHHVAFSLWMCSITFTKKSFSWFAADDWIPLFTIFFVLELSSLLNSLLFMNSIEMLDLSPVDWA